MTEHRYPWWMPLAAVVSASLISVLGATWRLTRVRMGEQDARLEGGERCIFAFWHARLLPLVYTHRGRSIAVLVSRHRDGELIARVLERLGYLTGRGSSTRGGEEGIRDMLRHARKGRMLGITPDGPRGPAERVKAGIVYVASRTGHPVLPLAAASASAWTLDSWDRFRVPKPFARVVVAYGPAIEVPPGVGEGEIETWRLRIEDAIRNLTDEVDRIAAEAGRRR